MSKFVVILVEPETPHNIGFVCRAMRCNALTDLRIVYENFNEVPLDAYHTAHNSKEILSNAKICKSLSEALLDCRYSIAFSRRVFHSVVPHVMLPEVSKNISKVSLEQDGHIALVFGRESKGLFLEEVNLCALVCEIPVPGLMSLNLAQAVSVACYELARLNLLDGEGRAHRPLLNNELSTVKEIERFQNFLMEHMTGRYKNQVWMKSFVHHFLQRAQPTKNELGALFGIARSLSGTLAKNEKSKEVKSKL